MLRAAAWDVFRVASRLIMHPSAGGGTADQRSRGRLASRERGDAPPDRLRVSTAHRNDLQGLRAVAVLLVVLDHAGVGFLKGGFVGVDVFFVLSGFLITGLLLHGAAKRGHVSLVDFYVRRARRILPAATLTLVATTIVADQLLNYVRAKQAVWDTFWASLFAANIRFAHQGTDYFAQGQPPSVVQHYWSLAVEEQFYVVWPALLSLTLFGAVISRRFLTHRPSARVAPMITGWALGRLLAVVIAVGVASLIWSIHYTNVLPAAAYFSTFARAWELALGAALAICSVRVAHIYAAFLGAAGWAGVIAISMAAVTFSGTTPFPGYAALLPTGGAALVIAAGMGDQPPRWGASRLLSIAPMRYIGDRSYAFYLWHWPVLVIAVLYEGHELSVGAKMLLLLGAFLLSVISYRLFENPIRRSRWSPRTSALLVPASVAVAVAVTMITLSSINAKTFRLEAIGTAAAAPTISDLQSVRDTVRSRPLPAVVAAVKAARQGAKIPARLTPPVSEVLHEGYDLPSGCTTATDEETKSKVCRLGDPSASKSIVLFGDSHAEMWMPTILPMAERDGWAIIPLVKSRCVASSWTEKGYPNTPGAILRSCHAWYRWAVQQAKAVRPDVILMAACCGAAAGTTAEEAKRAYVALAATMRRFAKSVILVEDDDGINKQPVDCLLARNATMKTCTVTQTEENYAFNNDLGAIAKIHRFGFLNTRGWFCSQFQCPMVVGGIIVYRDTGHITQAYGRKLAGPFTDAFRHCIFDTCPT